MVDALKRTLKVPHKFVPYMETHQIYELFHELTNRLVVEQPMDHIHFIRNRLQEIRITRNTPRIVLLAPPFFDTARLASLMCKAIGCLPLTLVDVLNEDDESNHLSGKYEEAELAKGVQQILNRNVRSLQGWLMTDIPRTRVEAINLQRMGILPTHTFLLVDSSENVPFLTITESSRCLSELRHVYQSTLIELEIGDRSIEELADICCGLVETKAHCKAAMLPRILIVGARGSGRQTQARHLCCRFNLVHVNFDTVLVRARQEKNKLADKIRWFETSTRPTPPTLLASVIEAALLAKDCLNQGWVLTGFPRNVAEFKALDLLSTPPNRIIFLDVKPTTCLERITARHINKYTGTQRNLRGDLLAEQRYRNYLSHPHDVGDVVKREIVSFMSELPKMLAYAAGTETRLDGNSALQAVCERTEAVVMRPPPFVEPRDPFAPDVVLADDDGDEADEDDEDDDDDLARRGATARSGEGDGTKRSRSAGKPMSGSDEDNLGGYLDSYTELVIHVEATLDEVLRRTVVIAKKPTRKYDERIHECLTIIRATPHSLDKGYNKWATERDGPERERQEREREEQLLAGMTSEERLRYSQMSEEEKRRLRDAAFDPALTDKVSSHLKKLAMDVTSDVFPTKENTLLGITAGIVKEVNRLTKEMIPYDDKSGADDTTGADDKTGGTCQCWPTGALRQDNVEDRQGNLSSTENILLRITSAIVEHLVEEAATAIVPINDHMAINAINTTIVSQLVSKVMNEMLPSVRKTPSVIKAAITDFIENQGAIVEKMPLEERKLIEMTSAIVKKLVNKGTSVFDRSLMTLKSTIETLSSSIPGSRKTPVDDKLYGKHASDVKYPSGTFAATTSAFTATTVDSLSIANVKEEVELSVVNMTAVESLKVMPKPTGSPVSVGATSDNDDYLNHEAKSHEVSEHAIMEASLVKGKRGPEAVDKEHDEDMDSLLMDKPLFSIQMATFPKVSAVPILNTVFEESGEDEQ